MVSRVTTLGTVTGLVMAAFAAQATSAPRPGQQASTETRIAALMQRVIANQKRNDQAIERYERFERRLKGNGEAVIEEKLYRMIPAGSRHEEVLVAVQGEPISKKAYASDLRDLESALDRVIAGQALQRDPQEVAYRTSGILDELLAAFHLTWVGREEQAGRSMVIIDLTPNPDYNSASRISRAFPHTRARMWIDEQAEQFARIEIDIVEDVSIGAGMLGKVYKGGHIFLEQASVAGDLWFLRSCGFVIEGRKVFFAFDKSRQITVTEYRHVGPPEKVLAMLHEEIESLNASPRAAPASTEEVAMLGPRPEPSAPGFGIVLSAGEAAIVEAGSTASYTVARPGLRSRSGRALVALGD